MIEIRVNGDAADAQVRAVLAAIAALGAPSATETPEKQAEPEKKAGSEKTAESEPAPEVTFEDLRRAGMAAINKGMRDGYTALLAKYGADRVTEVDQAKWPQLLADTEALYDRA